MSPALLPHAFLSTPDGARLRYARFEPVNKLRGTLLILPGRREFIEKKYFEVCQPLSETGFRIYILEPRGQGLSTRLLSEPIQQRDHSETFNIHLSDLRLFFASVVTPDAAHPIILHGHSMGGHLIVRWLAEDHPPVKAAFLTAPMLALSNMPAHLAAHGLTWLGVRLFHSAEEYAPLQQDFGAAECVFADNVLTHDETRFRLIEEYFTRFPDLKVGGVTWGWLLAALRSMQRAHVPRYLGGIDIPILALVGSEDKVTPAKEILPYLNLIPRVQTHVIPGSRHDTLNESDGPRREAWRIIHDFLRPYVGA